MTITPNRKPKSSRPALDADLTTLIVESLVDIILRVPAEEQAQLMAHTLAALGDFFLQKSGADNSGSGLRH